MDKNLLKHAVINQLEVDFGDSDYDAMDELFTMLLKNNDNVSILHDYFSDTGQQNLAEGLTHKRWDD